MITSLIHFFFFFIISPLVFKCINRCIRASVAVTYQDYVIAYFQISINREHILEFRRVKADGQVTIRVYILAGIKAVI